MLSRITLRLLRSTLACTARRVKTVPNLQRYVHTSPAFTFKYSSVLNDTSGEHVAVDHGTEEEILRRIEQASDEEQFSYDDMLMKSAEAEGDEDEIEDIPFELNDEDVRANVLSVALENVAIYGWSKKSIESAMEALEVEPSKASLFQRGGLDLVLFFIEEGNNALIEHIAKEAKETNLDSEEARAAFIERAMKTRLQMVAPYIDTWPEALKLMASPDAAGEVFQNGANLMDEIWYHAGDLDTDMTWYAKRAGLAAIAASAELFMLNDKSPDFQDTWEFLHRRLNEARALNSAKDSLVNAAGDLGGLVNAGISTAQNILGGLGGKR